MRSYEYFFYNSRICILSNISLLNLKSLRLFSCVAFKGFIVLMLKFGYMIYINQFLYLARSLFLCIGKSKCPTSTVERFLCFSLKWHLYLFSGLSVWFYLFMYSLLILLPILHYTDYHCFIICLKLVL